MDGEVSPNWRVLLAAVVGLASASSSGGDAQAAPARSSRPVAAAAAMRVDSLGEELTSYLHC
jgi:hypothetical protein